MAGKRNDGDVVVEVVADLSDFDAGMKKAEAAAERSATKMAASMNKANKEAEKNAKAAATATEKAAREIGMLEAKYDPLIRAEQRRAKAVVEINRLLKEQKFTSEQAAVAITGANNRYTASVNRVAKAAVDGARSQTAASERMQANIEKSAKLEADRAAKEVAAVEKNTKKKEEAAARVQAATDKQANREAAAIDRAAKRAEAEATKAQARVERQATREATQVERSIQRQAAKVAKEAAIIERQTQQKEAKEAAAAERTIKRQEAEASRAQASADKQSSRLVFQAERDIQRKAAAATRAQAQSDRQAERETVNADKVAARQVAAEKRLSERTAKQEEAQKRQIESQSEQAKQRHDPVYKAEQERAKTLKEIQALQKSGAYTEKQAAEAATQAAGRYIEQVNNIKRSHEAMQRSSGLAGHALTNLSYQLNDVITMATSGASAFQILTTQGGQIYQILGSAPGGVAAGLKDVGMRVVGLINPLTATVALFTALGIAATTAAVQWDNASSRINIGLMGTGRASGASLSSINQAAQENSRAGGISVASGRDAAGTLASFGVRQELIGPALRMMRDFSVVMGQDMPEAAATLGQALADPVRGLETLNARLNISDDLFRTNLRTLDASGDRLATMRSLLDRVGEAAQGSAAHLTAWEQVWHTIGVTISDTLAPLGEATARMMTGGTLEERRSAAQARIADLERQQAERPRRTGFMQPQGLRSPAQVNAELAEQRNILLGINTQLERQGRLAEEAQQRIRSLRVGEAVRAVVPDIARREQLQNRLNTLNDPGNAGIMTRMGMSQADQQLAQQRAQSALQTLMTEEQVRQRRAQIDQQAVTARSPAQRQRIEEMRTELELNGQNLTSEERLNEVRRRGQTVLMEGRFALSEAARERLQQLDQQNVGAQQDIDLVGRTTGEVERLRLEHQQLSAVEAEAARNRTAVNQREVEAIQARAAQYGILRQQLAVAEIRNDIRRERVNTGLTEGEVQIAERLRKIYPDVATALNSVEAGMMRVNQQLQLQREISQEAFSSFVSDLRRGTDWATALSNSLDRVADRLTRLATDQAFAAIFGGGSKQGAGFNIFSALGLNNLFGTGASNAITGPAVKAHMGTGNYEPIVVNPADYTGARTLHAGLMSDEFRAKLRQGEQVMDRERSARTASLIQGLTAMAATQPDQRGAPMKIQVVNQSSGSKVRPQQAPNGDIRIMVSDIMAGELSNPNSNSTKAISSIHRTNRSRGLARG